VSEKKATADGSTGQAATTKKDDPIFKLKVVENNPVSGEPEQKEIERTVPEVIAMAQKGYRYEDKAHNFNLLVDQKAEQKAKEIIASEVEKKASELLDNFKAELEDKKVQDETFKDIDFETLSDTEKATLKVVDKLKGDIKSMEDAQKDRDKKETDLKKLAERYDMSSKKALSENQELDKETLKKFVIATRASPESIPVLASLLSQFSTAKVDVTKLDKTSRVKLEQAIEEKLVAPSVGIEGDVGQEEVKVPTTREGILDKALDLLDNMEANT
jgi:hypothetical protein